MTLKELYLTGKQKIECAGIDNPGLEASLLISEVFGTDKIHIYTKAEAQVCSDRLKEFDEIVARRISGEPIAYILGDAEFYSRTFLVGPGVLIPRPETEILVEEALSVIGGISSPLVIDVGTGSGCIALTLGSERRDSMVVASDISFDAITVARDNAKRLDVRNVFFVQSDFLDFAKGRSCDIVVSNPPYVSETELDRLEHGIRGFEPLLALNGGKDGLDCIRRVASGAIGVLKSGGWCIMEIGADQDEDAMGMVATLGYREISLIADLSGVKRIMKARWII